MRRATGEKLGLTAFRVELPLTKTLNTNQLFRGSFRDTSGVTFYAGLQRKSMVKACHMSLKL